MPWLVYRDLDWHRNPCSRKSSRPDSDRDRLATLLALTAYAEERDYIGFRGRAFEVERAKALLRMRRGYPAPRPSEPARRRQASHTTVAAVAERIGRAPLGAWLLLTARAVLAERLTREGQKRFVEPEPDNPTTHPDRWEKIPETTTIMNGNDKGMTVQTGRYVYRRKSIIKKGT